MKILFLEGYYGGSHRAFADGWKMSSRHDIRIMSLPDRKWKWRMQTGSWMFYEQLLKEGFSYKPDLIFATDMINLAEFLGLTRRHFGDIPSVLYFHENQFVYPARSEEPDFTWAAINVASALAADQLIFNSKFNRDSFFDSWLKGNRRMPDVNIPEKRIHEIREKSKIIPVGVDFEFLDLYEVESSNKIPLILWNHRWEHDKGPDEFFEVIRRLRSEGLKFHLAVCGENFSDVPDCFEKAGDEFSDIILHFGYLPTRMEYALLLWKSDIVISTARQEFLGLSVIEAMWCGCYPLLPNRLSYPGLLPEKLHERHLYSGADDLIVKLDMVLKGGVSGELFEARAEFLRKFGWETVIEMMDSGFVISEGEYNISQKF